MAVIQKIRDKYAKVAGGVIVLALVGFIMMDATSGGRGSLFGNSTTVGKVNGEKIDVVEYEARIKAYEAQLKQQNPQMQMDEATQAQIRDQVFNQMVQDKLTAEINEKLGLSVSDAELKDMMLGNNPDPMVRQAFTNPQTGQFNPQEMAQQITQLDRSKDPEMKANWAGFKQQLREGRLQSKFTALVNGSVYSPKFVLDDLHEGRANIANINYVALPYTLVGDDKVKVTDADIKKFIEAHRKQFELKEENRSVDYVSFNIVPSKEDSARVFTALDTLKASFAANTDPEAFANRNSEIQIPVSYHTPQTLQSIPNAAELLAAAPGTVVGPFVDGENVTLAKVIEKANFPDSVKVRHILVMTKQGQNPVRTDTQANARMDSVLALLNSGTAFDSLVVRFSDDYNPQNPTGSKGEYEFPLQQKGQLTKEFADFAFSGAQGAKKVVKVESDGYSGYHYIEILRRGKETSSSKIAFVSKALNADNATYNNLYAQASGFANKVAANPKNFDREVMAGNLNKQQAVGLNKNSFSVANLGSSSELVKWAYSAKIGDVSPIYTIGGNKFVVAKLTEVNPAGLLKPTGANKTALENYLKQQKKAQILIDANKGKTLEAIASGNNQQVGSADSVTFNGNNIPNLGNEPKVMGYAFNKSFKPNTVSPGIAGMNAVYFITVRSTGVNASMGRNAATEQQMSDYMLRSGAGQMILESLKNSAKVSDLRSKVYK